MTDTFLYEHPELHLCDPKKNTECTKEWCYINGGECYYTTHEEYAVEEEEHED